MNIEPLESRIAPAATFTFADVDGDFVTIKTSKGTDGELSAILTLAPEGLGMELREIDFSANSVAFFGTDLTVNAKRTSVGGDGRVNVGYIDAIDFDDGASLNVGNVRVGGDLGRINAGTSSASVSAVKSLTVQSLGEFGTSTQGATANIGSSLFGALGKFNVAGNVRGHLIALGAEIGKIGSVTIGGSLIGEEAGTGRIRSAASMGPVKIGGNIEGNGEDSGTLVAVNLASVTIGGSLLGGSFPGSGSISADSIGLMKIGGNIQGGAIRVAGPIGAIMVKGSIIGNATERVLITVLGQTTSTAASDLAIKSLTVGGRVEFADILAGYYSLSFTPPIGLNADVQIGRVVVGDWIASSLVAGVQDDEDSDFDAFFGDGNDVKITLDADDAPNVVSKIASILIKGTARGTIGGSDHFGFVAQQIGSFRIGVAAFPLVSGPASALDIAGYPVGITGDLRLREVAL